MKGSSNFERLRKEKIRMNKGLIGKRKLRELTRWCQNEGSWGGAGDSHGGEGGRCLGHVCMKEWSVEGCPHTCRGLKWCIVVIGGGNPMVGASHGPPSLFPPLPPTPYMCLLWLQFAASASRASKCFLWDLYFCTQIKKTQKSSPQILLFNYYHSFKSKHLMCGAIRQTENPTKLLATTCKQTNMSCHTANVIFIKR